MFGLSRLLVVLALVAGILALISRFVQAIIVVPDTWLAATAILLLLSIAVSLIGIGDQLAKKTA